MCRVGLFLLLCNSCSSYVPSHMYLQSSIIFFFFHVQGGASGRGEAFVDFEIKAAFKYKKFTMWQKFSFDVNKLCSTTRLTTLYSLPYTWIILVLCWFTYHLSSSSHHTQSKHELFEALILLLGRRTSSSMQSRAVPILIQWDKRTHESLSMQL